MRKLTYVLRRREGMTLEEFQRYWLERHAPLVQSHAATLGIRRYAQVHALPSGPRREDPVRGPMLEPFDGVAELWFDPDARSDDGEARRRAGRALAEDEANFIDFARSASWSGEEHVIIDGWRRR